MSLEYRSIAPPAALAGIVRCFWTLRGDAPVGERPVERVIPDGSPELVLHLGEPFEQVSMDGRAMGAEPQPAALVAGQLLSPLLIAPTGAIDIVAVRFHPWGLARLLGGADLAELTDRRVALSDLSRTLDDALDAVRAAPGRAERLRALSTALAEAAGGSAGSIADPIAAAAVRIEERGGTLPIAALCREVRIHERTLERGFRRRIGIAPKRFARIVRFQRFFRALDAAPDEAVGGLALDCGYADQPHLLRDARELAGGTPGRLGDGTTLSRLFARG